MTQKIVIIDYGMGNLNSVKRKLSLIGVKAVISSDSSTIINANKIILPGVGHFKKAVENLRKLKLWEILNDIVLKKKTPILGICLGMQLMAKHSEEGNAEGFGWFDADVIKFRINNVLKYKVPHMGWNNLIMKRKTSLFDGVDLSSEFYFVHSYHLKCFNQEHILTETVYENSFVSSIQKENIYGVQYHPEKSHDAGELLLNNFIKM
jgi:imidazole glycerol-phosphate synthase subunit HisH